ncbi:MAG: glycoside hydrolase family 15 protein [bacterium]|nr:glycoside hydrolase family 15 protein [bacterium]
MPRSLTLANGTLLAGIDGRAQVRDLYFPYIGLENQVGGHLLFRIGVWAEGDIAWFDDPSWQIEVRCASESLVGKIQAVNERLGVRIEFTDLVYNEKAIFVREAVVRNMRSEKRIVKIYFCQEFEIYESHRGDTAYLDPFRNVVVHYKGRRAFLINAVSGAKGFDDYSIGLFGIEGKEGTFRDAEDGLLAKSPIEHGSVDSVVGVTLQLEAEQEKTVFWWLAAGKSIAEVQDLNEYILDRSPQHLMKTTQDFWRAWVNRRDFCFYGLDGRIVDLFKKSLLIIRAHGDREGSILASSDSDMLQHGRDTYGYMWPRDGAYAALALDKAGDTNVAQRFFEFCNQTITEDGYFMHKYWPDKSLGSSWHPWVRGGKTTLPIQEDETALVIWALWQHYEISKDLEFVEDIYNSLIKKAAGFMMRHVDASTGLPFPSYDLWEEKYGTSTFTASAVQAALKACGNFAKLLGKSESADAYASAAEKIRHSIMAHLYDEGSGSFYKMINSQNGSIEIDKTLDMSSFYGVVTFGVLAPDDERLIRAMRLVEEQLAIKTPVGGIPRYASDRYYAVSDVANPWIITTLWLAEYLIAAAKNEKDLDGVKKWLSWVADHASTSGMLPEQVHPYDGTHLSASPLTWSHSAFVITVIKYLEKLEDLGVSPACNPVKAK